ncbi:hypothetical protein [Brucella pituitosa]
MKKYMFIAAIFSLSGCQNGGIGMAESPAWFATATPEQQMAYFSKRCSAYGFKAGSTEMAQCLMIESRSSRNSASVRSAIASQSIANSQPRHVTTNCNKFGNNVTCHSY